MAQGAGIAYLTAYIGADTVAFRNGMAQVRRDLMDIGGIASGLQDIGKTLTYTITAPIVGAMGVAVSQFAEFEAEMRNIAAISPLVAQDFDGISDTIRRMGQEFRIGADGMAQALYTVQSAGFGLNDVNEALTVTEQSAKLAEAGLSSIIPTTNALVGSLLAYGEGADMAQYHSDVLAQTVALGVGSMEGLLTTMSSSLPQAAALGISFDDLGSTLAFMTQQGFNWARAGTGVGNVFNKLITPSEALKAIYEDLGAGSGQELIEMFGGLGGALQEIYNIVGDDPEKIRKLFPDDRGFRIALGIFENFDRYTSLLADFDATLDGATDSQRQQQMQSFSYKFDVMKSFIEGFLIAVGGAVAPVLEPLVEGIADLFQTIANAPPELLTLGTVFAGIAAAIPPIIWGVGLLLTPLGAALALVVGLGALFASNFDSIKNWIDTNMPMVGAGIDAVGDAIQRFADILTGTTWERDQSSVIMGGHELPQSPYPNLVEQQKTFGERLQEAFAATRDQMILGLQWAFIGVRSWVETTGISEFDRIVGSFVNGLAGAFGSSGQTGKSTPVTDSIRNLLGGGVQSALAGLGSWVDQNLPDLKAGFSALLINIGTWIETDGATTLGYAVGYIAVAIGNVLGTAIGAVLGGTGKQESEFLLNIRRGFEQGLEDAFTDFEITAGLDKALTLAAGAVAVALAARMLLGGGIPAIGSAVISMITSAVSWAAGTVTGSSFIATGLALANPVALGIAAGMAIYSAMGTETRDSIHDFIVNNIISPINQFLGGGGITPEMFDTGVEDLIKTLVGRIENMAKDNPLSLLFPVSILFARSDEEIRQDVIDRVSTALYGTSMLDGTGGSLEIPLVVDAQLMFGGDDFDTQLQAVLMAQNGLTQEDFTNAEGMGNTFPKMREFGGKLGKSVVDSVKNSVMTEVTTQQPFNPIVENVNLTNTLVQENVTQMTTLVTTKISAMVLGFAPLLALMPPMFGTAFTMVNDAIKIPVSNIVTQMNSIRNAANDALAAIGAASSAPMPTLPAAGGSGGDGSSGKGVGAKIYITSNNPERIFSQTRSTGVDLVNKPVNSKISVWGG